MTPVALVDSNVLVAAFIASDPNHDRCAAVLADAPYRLLVPALCVAEAAYLLARDVRPRVEADFLEALQELEVVAPEPDDWPRIAALVRQYADFPLGGTDASIVVLAERLNTDLILTLDRRHFGAIKPAHVPSLRILPD